MRMKYIRFKNNGLNVIVQFQELITHKKMAQCLRSQMDTIDPLMDHACISAGFTEINSKGEIFCFGESESIGIKSLPEDSQILQNQYNPY